MKHSTLSLILVLWLVPQFSTLAATATAQGKLLEQPAQPLPAPVIILPDPPAPPIPPPSPNTVTTLSAGQMYVIRCQVQCVVLTSPQGMVKVTPENGPIRVRGMFTDGSGVETRQYNEAHVWMVEAATTGSCELLVFPSGATDAAAVIRRSLMVSVGPPVPPIPPAPPDPLTTLFQAAYAADGGQLDRVASLAFLTAAYKGMATTVVAQPIKTNGDAVNWTRSVVDNATVGLTPAQLANLRRAIGSEFASKFGTSTTAAIDKSVLAAELSKIANALQGVK